MFSIKCGVAPIALDIHLEDGGLVDQAIDEQRASWLGRENLPHSPKG
jgi:hypothetical protein